MDQDRFFFEVDREAAEIDFVNSELQILAQEAADEAADEQYREWLDSILDEFYGDEFPDSDWDI